MSHFLQRITSAAAQPQAKLHPMIGSIFAPSGFYVAVDPNRAQHSKTSLQQPLESIVTTSFADGTPSTDNLHTEVPSRADQLFDLASREEISTTLRSTRDSPAYLPLLPNRSNSEEARLKPFTDVNDFTTSPSSELRPTQQEADSSNARAQNQATNPIQYQPLVLSPQPQALPPLLPQAASTNLSRGARNDTNRRIPSPQHEADEIHIHIGRIEVSAIASNVQQPSRPAAPARRSLNLEEYLRRGNGRAR